MVLNVSFRDKILMFTWRKRRQKSIYRNAGLCTLACGTEAVCRSETREAACLLGGRGQGLLDLDLEGWQG